MKHFVFGPPGKVKPGNDTSSDSSNDSKGNPLLDYRKANDNSTTNGILGRNDKNYRKKQLLAAKYAEDRDAGLCATLCSCIGHLLILFLPLLAMSVMLAFLILLLVYDKNEIQQVELEGDEDYMDIAKLYYASMSTDTISLIVSQYEPYLTVLGLSCTSCILFSLVTVARCIQIEVYHKRTESFIFMKFINYLACLINILAYFGLLVAINFRVTQEEPAWSMTAHFIGFLTYFAGTATYSVLHIFLLLNQSEYNFFVKLLFLCLSITIVLSSLAFGIPIWESGLSSDEGPEPVLEWVAVFASTISIGLYEILFHIDPVDDELGALFCGPEKSHHRRRYDRRRSRRNSQPLTSQTRPLERGNWQI